MNRFTLILCSLFLFLIGCRSSKIIRPEPSTSPLYSIIYVIHGDANYLYHNAEGQALQADEHVLDEARKVARNAEHGEVFIYHQNPERKILWLFPKKDRRFLYYRNGSLVHEQKYSPQSKKQSFVTEAALYTQFHSKKNNTPSYKKIFLYFGHEVPQESGRVYHYSRSDAPFDTEIFAQGVQSFLDFPEDSFNLTVLSTCNNGTPAMVQALSPYTQYVLASPQNLHLSHIDTQSLALLEQPDRDTRQITDSLAGDTFTRLSSFLQTVVTLSAYDTGTVQSYLPAFNHAYENYLGEKPEAAVAPDNVDCATFSFFKEDAYKKGVTVWYKAPRFGSKEHASDYSGWGCRE